MPSLGHNGLRPCTTKKQPKNRYQVMKNILLFVAAASIFAACNSSAEGEKKNEAPVEKSISMERAERMHEDAIALYNEVKKTVDQMRAEYDDEMANIGEGVPEDEMILKERWGILLKRFTTDLQAWNDELVEVPGHAHTHDHGDGHDHHDHNHEQDRILEGISDEEHLKIQVEQLNAIKKIADRVNEAVKSRNQ